MDTRTDRTVDSAENRSSVTLEVRVSHSRRTPSAFLRQHVGETVRGLLWRSRDGLLFGGRMATKDGVRILAICAVCRRVRNASGDWAALPERWWPRPIILSHGYCPACFEQEYSAPPVGLRYTPRPEADSLSTADRDGRQDVRIIPEACLGKVTKPEGGAT